MGPCICGYTVCCAVVIKIIRLFPSTPAWTNFLAKLLQAQGACVFYKYNYTTKKGRRKVVSEISPRLPLHSSINALLGLGTFPIGEKITFEFRSRVCVMVCLKGHGHTFSAVHFYGRFELGTKSRPSDPNPVPIPIAVTSTSNRMSLLCSVRLY